MRFDDSRMKVFIVSEQLEISGVVFKIRLWDNRTLQSKHVPKVFSLGGSDWAGLTFSLSEFSSSCLISFSLASFTACFVTARIASYVQKQNHISKKVQLQTVIKHLTVNKTDAHSDHVTSSQNRKEKFHFAWTMTQHLHYCLPIVEFLLLILANVTPFKREIDSLSNSTRFIAMKHWYYHKIIQNTNFITFCNRYIHKLFTNLDLYLSKNSAHSEELGFCNF